MASFIHSNRPYSFPSVNSFESFNSTSPQPSPYFHLDQSALTTFFASSAGMMSTAKASRTRRKSNSTSDQVKHRRTRSGCLTCRARRVKCDEARPTCERCQKGGRECSYPEPPVSKSSSASGSTKSKRERPETSTSTSASNKEQSSSPEGTIDYDDEEDYAGTDEAEYSVASSPVDSQLLNPTNFPRYRSKRKPSKSLSPLIDPLSSRRHTSPHPAALDNLSLHSFNRSAVYLHEFKSEPSITVLEPSPVESTFESTLDFSKLSPDVAFFLEYHQREITCQHYLLKTDQSQFFRTSLLSYALDCEALLYAVVAFASFHYHVHHMSSKYDDFLEYYNKAVACLRYSFEGSREPDLATLITILQIATIEEYLGDWSNLVQHRKGALMILESIFTPETILESTEGSLIFVWFARLDIFVATMSGQETILGLEYYEFDRNLRRSQNLNGPQSEFTIFNEAESNIRYSGMEITNLLARRGNGSISSEVFLSIAMTLQEDINEFWHQLHPTLAVIHRESSVSRLSLQENDNNNGSQYYPRLQEASLAANYLFAEVHALGLLLMHHTSLARGSHHEYMHHHSLSICKIFTAAEDYVDIIPKSLLPLQYALGMAAIWMPDVQHRSWFRSKFAKLESMGSLCPVSFRTQLATLWDDPSLRFSWLPYHIATSSTSSLDGGIIMSIRNLAEIRDAELPADQSGLNMKTINNLFGFVDIDTTESQITNNYYDFQSFDNQLHTYSMSHDSLQSGSDVYYQPRGSPFDTNEY